MRPSLPPSHCLVGAAPWERPWLRCSCPVGQRQSRPWPLPQGGASQACGVAESRRPKIRYRIQASSVTPAEPSIVCTVDEVNSRMQATKIGRAHSELQSLMRITYAVFCLKQKTSKTLLVPSTAEQ